MSGVRSPLPQVMTCAELAHLMGCQQSTIESRARRGLLPGLKFGVGWVFPTEATLKSLNDEARETALERVLTPSVPTLVINGHFPLHPPKLPTLPSLQ